MNRFRRDRIDGPGNIDAQCLSALSKLPALGCLECGRQFKNMTEKINHICVVMRMANYTNSYEPIESVDNMGRTTLMCCSCNMKDTPLDA